jgi:hypothetical protein
VTNDLILEPGKTYSQNLKLLSTRPPHEAAEIWLTNCKRDERLLADLGFHGASIERLLQGAYAALDYSDALRDAQRSFVVEILRVALDQRQIESSQTLKLVQAIGNSIQFHELHHGSERLRRSSFERGLTDRWGGELPVEGKE